MASPTELPFVPSSARLNLRRPRRLYESAYVGQASHSLTQNPYWEGEIEFPTLTTAEEVRIWYAFIAELEVASGGHQGEIWIPAYSPDWVQGPDDWVILTAVANDPTHRRFALTGDVPPPGSYVQTEIQGLPLLSYTARVGDPGEFENSNPLFRHIQLLPADQRVIRANWKSPRIRGVAINEDYQSIVQSDRLTTDVGVLAWREARTSIIDAFGSFASDDPEDFTDQFITTEADDIITTEDDAGLVT